MIFPGPKYLTAYQLSDGKLQRKQVPGVQLGQRVAASPDGKLWATTKDDGNDQGIVLFDLSGSQITTPGVLTGYGSDQLSWSPDGKMLAFAYNPSQDHSNYLNNVRLLTFHADGRISFLDIGNFLRYENIAWSPDSRFLYLSTTEDKNRVQIYDVVNMVQAAVPVSLKNSDHISLSPDGNRIVAKEDIEKGNPLFLYDLTTGERKVFPLPPEYANDDYLYINAIFWLRK